MEKVSHPRRPERERERESSGRGRAGRARARGGRLPASVCNFSSNHRSAQILVFSGDRHWRQAFQYMCRAVRAGRFKREGRVRYKASDSLRRGAQIVTPRRESVPGILVFGTPGSKSGVYFWGSHFCRCARRVGEVRCVPGRRLPRRACAQPCAAGPS